MAEALKKVRADVEWLEDRFEHNTKDVDWLRAAGEAGWLVIVRDKRILRRPGELQAVIENRVGCFILNQRSDPTRWEYLKLLALTLDRMQELDSRTARPYIFTVSRDGDLRQVLP